jgi:hypothetical protein
MAVAVHIKRQLEVVGRGGLAEGVRPTDQVLKAEELAKDVRGGPDAHHRR